MHDSVSIEVESGAHPGATEHEELVERFVRLAMRGGPLEHLRFPADALADGDPDALCGAGWLAWCERELVHALRFVAGDDAAALRGATVLLRRYGAQAAIVEALAALQEEERHDRALRRRDVLADDVDDAVVARDAAIDDARAWLESAPVHLLSFAETSALALLPAERAAELWRSGIADRVLDRAIERAGDGARAEAERRRWRALTVLLASPLGRELIPALLAGGVIELLPEEHAALDAGPELDRLLAALELARAAREDRGSYADAALLRETVRSVRLRATARRAR